MQRLCDLVDCRRSYEAKSKASRFCSGRCRQRAHQGAASVDVWPTEALPDPVALPVAPAGTNRVTSATLRALEDASRVDTALGQAALALAERIDSGKDTGAGLASLSREWRATLASATAGAGAEKSPLDRARDDLAARRARRGA